VGELPKGFDDEYSIPFAVNEGPFNGKIDGRLHTAVDKCSDGRRIKGG
jgi:hypothetical protein